MPELTMGETPKKAPWHLWVVGVLSLLWNASGAWVFVQAQTGAAMDMDAAEIAYYAEQPIWMVALTDIAFAAAILAAIALLLRSRWAVGLYALSLAAIIVSSALDIGMGTAPLLQGQDWLILSLVTTGLAVLQWLYARTSGKRGVLR
jgi:hypothetical protein